MLVRNLLAQFIIAGFWDWLLYFSPLKEKFAPFKMNPKYPSNKQIFHDMFWTTSATITGTMIEIFLCYPLEITVFFLKLQFSYQNYNFPIKITVFLLKFEFSF